MISKNISVKIKKNQEVPFKETYIVIHNSKQKVYLHQKFINSRKNQKIDLKFEECKRLMNLLSIYVFKGNYEYSKDKVIIYREGIQTEK
ncbi:MAG: hypothetical protein ACFFBT_01580 [Promethearchaeota archaeon]